MSSPIEVRTSRLLLRQWREADHAPFAELNADPEVMAHFPHGLTRAQSDFAAERLAAHIEQRGYGFWAVEAPGVSSFVGFVGIQAPRTPGLPFAPCVEIGWRLARAHWGKGYATEAAQAALRVGFEMVGLTEIVSFTAVSNLRSQAVMQRLGMQARGEYFDHPSVAQGHPVRPHVLYRLPREIWWQAQGRASA